MKILEKAKLITVEKNGQWHHYSIKEESVAELFLSMEKVFNDAKK
jgi:ArsR family transcriptional regulator